MSDERNADSVLFKLDTLSAMQAQKTSTSATSGGAPRQMARLAAQAPASEAGSGLIDLRTLGGAPAPPEEATDASGSGSELASSAALSQSSLLSSSGMMSALPTPNSTPSLTPAAPPSRTPLIVLSILALLALIAAVTAIILRA